MFDETTAHEAAQHALDHGAQRAVHLGEPLRIDAEKVLEMLLDEPEQRRLPRPPRPVDPAGDLHAQPRAGGRDTGRKRRRTVRLRGASLGHQRVRSGPGGRVAGRDPIAQGNLVDHPHDHRPDGAGVEAEDLAGPVSLVEEGHRVSGPGLDGVDRDVVGAGLLAAAVEVVHEQQSRLSFD